MSDGIRITKPGKLPGTKILTGKCRICGCEFEALYGLWELKTSFRSQTSWLQIKCPQDGCGNLVYNYSL